MIISNADKLTCAERELKLRRRVYPNFILTHRIPPAKAEREIAVMEAIVADYQELVQRDRLL